MKVIIAGGRDFSDYELLKRECDSYLCGMHGIEIVSGAANGADKLGERYADERNFSLKRFSADWNRYGRGAGTRRNQ